MENSDYKEKYKQLKRKFKALQIVSFIQEHLKISSQFDLSAKSIKILKREISFMEEKIGEIQKKSLKPVKKPKIEDQEELNSI